MATKKPLPLTAMQQVALSIASAYYAGPAGHALLDAKDDETTNLVVQRAVEFANLFLEKTV